MLEYSGNKTIEPAPNRCILKVLDDVRKTNITLLESAKQSNPSRRCQVVVIGRDVLLDINIDDIVLVMAGEGEYTHNVIRVKDDTYYISDYQNIIAFETKEGVMPVDNGVVVCELSVEARRKLEKGNTSNIILLDSIQSRKMQGLKAGKVISSKLNDIKPDEVVYYSFGYTFVHDDIRYTSVFKDNVSMILFEEDV